MRILLDLIGLVWHLFLPQVSALFMSVAHLLLLRLFELASLWLVQFGCLYLAVGMYLFDGLLVVLYMNQIRSLSIHNFSIIGVQLLPADDLITSRQHPRCIIPQAVNTV